MKTQKTILGFFLKDGQKRAIQLLCEREQIRFTEILEKDCWKTLGVLAGIKGFPEIPPDGVTDPEGEKVSDPMLVFSGFPQEELQEFLAAYRRTGESSVELKAVMTMHNISWTPVMLQHELRQEHAAMKGGKSV